MEQTPKTSFIPKQTIGVAKNRQRRSINIFTVIAMIVFLAVLTLSVGVFFYERYSESELAIEKAKLADFHKNFSADAEDDIEEIRTLDRRFQTARELLNNHVALSKVFDALEDRTQESVQFTSFAFERVNSGKATVVLAGSAASFNTVALQERQLQKESALDSDSIVFSDFNTTDSGDVVFSVDAAVDTQAVAYTALPIKSGAATSTSTVSATSTSTRTFTATSSPASIATSTATTVRVRATSTATTTATTP